MQIDILDFYWRSVYIRIVFRIVNTKFFLFYAFITNVMRIWSFLWMPAQYKFTYWIIIIIIIIIIIVKRRYYDY